MPLQKIYTRILTESGGHCTRWRLSQYLLALPQQWSKSDSQNLFQQLTFWICGSRGDATGKLVMKITLIKEIYTPCPRCPDSVTVHRFTFSCQRVDKAKFRPLVYFLFNMLNYYYISSFLGFLVINTLQHFHWFRRNVSEPGENSRTHVKTNLLYLELTMRFPVRLLLHMFWLDAVR